MVNNFKLKIFQSDNEVRLSFDSYLLDTIRGIHHLFNTSSSFNSEGSWRIRIIFLLESIVSYGGITRLDKTRVARMGFQSKNLKGTFNMALLILDRAAWRDPLLSSNLATSSIIRMKSLNFFPLFVIWMIICWMLYP